MPPKKRYAKPGESEHRGRVTAPRDPTSMPDIDSPCPTGRSGPAAQKPTQPPAASSRYTPSIKSVRLRPGWHKAVGVGFIVFGVTVIVLNDVMRVADVTLLPGGHSELYLLLGIVIAAYSLKWFGWFDRGE